MKERDPLFHQIQPTHTDGCGQWKPLVCFHMEQNNLDGVFDNRGRKPFVSSCGGRDSSAAPHRQVFFVVLLLLLLFTVKKSN